MEAEFRNFIKKNKLVADCKKLLLAVSGGPDSLAMLDLFYKLRKELNLKIAVAHLDHMLREESRSEAEFVENFTKNKDIEFFSKQVNLPEIIRKHDSSAEAAAREERFNFFKELMLTNNFDLLALAHHRDDQAETVLLNLFRGAGLQGLSGIQAAAEVKGIKVIHPLLNFSKKEILNYCDQNNLEPRFDSSNQKNIYSRNVIRNEIFPVVEAKINSKAREVIARSSKLLAAENKFLQQLALKKYRQIIKAESNEKITVDLNQFKKTDQVLQRRIYRLIYERLNDTLENLYLDHIFEIEKLIRDKQTGRGVDIAAGIRVEISYSNLVFLKKEKLREGLINKFKIGLEKEIKIDEERSLKTEIVDAADFSFSDNPQQAVFDYDKLQLPLFIRNRKDGDKLRPLGMRGYKKVKDILIDKKVPKYERSQLLLIVDAADNIVWLAPYKISDEYKITKETDKVLILELKYN
ncbi:tRNA(Ile)-lysidine synthase [Halanaerobium saccharolyticum]|uniref:tRNA(Ile)-lysidine synthase n=1 Tax=Halanaerobium saccharolyticum TaxID=43595 RepID=A0A4V3G446_9FIRM|nr:tRNA lysidine(34) synthetase TilS [Halanaerobium saccharolyticum]RAK05120.1 tRNA(Ile)-lysidine synthase [Halanaerobium saccharolyticum]TDV98887.1 tRNA(Ile)-lysidine synthase [Halanaerobium saccharolyticum]TDX51589.1 tRNA(Ile)-lysidine synthase [Halanaerobium saccharolyticum]